MRARHKSPTQRSCYATAFQFSQCLVTNTEQTHAYQSNFVTGHFVSVLDILSWCQNKRLNNMKNLLNNSFWYVVFTDSRKLRHGSSVVLKGNKKWCLFAEKDFVLWQVTWHYMTPSSILAFITYLLWLLMISYGYSVLCKILKTVRPPPHFFNEKWF